MDSAKLLVDVERDRHRLQIAVGQTHAVAHRLVVRPVHEALQWREGARQQHFEIAELTRAQIPGWQRRRLMLERFGLAGRDQAII